MSKTVKTFTPNDFASDKGCAPFNLSNDQLKFILNGDRHGRKVETSLAFFVFLFVVTLNPQFALAAANGSEWVAPAIGFIGQLEGGLVQAGAALIGIGIIIFGTIGGLSGDMNWRRIGYSVVGGIFVMAGPKMLATLLTALQ